MDSLLLKLDRFITDNFAQWDVYTTTMLVGLVVFVAYQTFTSRDPDTHPLLLARQSQAAPIRNQGESAIYRSHSSPHSTPLSSGLNIKDEGDPKWSRGRNGDLRDIWRKVVNGVEDREGKKTGEVGKIMTVLGFEQIVDHKLLDVTRQINIVGQHIKQNHGTRVAIYLPNSVEFLATLFACAFYDLTAILLPFDKEDMDITPHLQQSRADTIIAAAGSLSFDNIIKSYPALRHMIWVVDEGSRHMDWNEVPSGTGGAVNVATWQDIVQDAEPNAGTEVKQVEKMNMAKPVLAFWPSGLMVELTQANLVAGIAGQLASVPTVQRINNTDLFIPVDSLSTIYPLVLTLSALFSNASVVLNSVSGKTADLTLATQGVAPTIIVASASTLAKVHAETKEKISSSIYNLVHWFQTRSLVQRGAMPLATMFSRAFDSLRPIIGNSPGKLRLIYVSEQVNAESTPLSAEMLSDLRIYTGARIIYALTTANVAGSVTQTGPYDYRVDQENQRYSHFGGPLTSVEVLFRDTKDHKTTDEEVVGEIVVRGPAVVDGETALGVSGKMKPDSTLTLL